MSWWCWRCPQSFVPFLSPFICLPSCSLLCQELVVHTYVCVDVSITFADSIHSAEMLEHI